MRRCKSLDDITIVYQKGVVQLVASHDEPANGQLGCLSRVNKECILPTGSMLALT